ncbi:AAC(3) family N-acetyltransferase [Sporanaerobium hydrogeniformans]|uniref:AAC(3) family N-acetyltransferase n=1 Tax=Sporanaerobium hydrogeniformans TaxID=3072179 RepID=A0AC61DEI1_9FIRM|nr:AAC(3) family N-acetyltransferase [Sporanaerobium hydrogeniformans]PHV71704.1 AAC(3) family N-acetyltransferase [Sporanaerobium hydrogeniformans]
MSYSKQDLIGYLKKLNIDPKGTLLVHSSMKSIGEVEGGADTVLDALMEYMKEGLLVLPTHTWAYINKENPRFYLEDSPSCVGILPELFRKRPGVVRAKHPTHSVAAIGKEAESFIADYEKCDTPCSKESPWGKLLEREATIMLLGVDLTRNTFIHGVEEWADIPGRLTDEPEPLVVVLKDGTEIDVPSRRHCGLRWSLHFWKVDKFFQERHVMKMGHFGDAEVRCCEAKPMTELLFQMLAINPDLFSDNEPLDQTLYLHREG